MTAEILPKDVPKPFWDIFHNLVDGNKDNLEIHVANRGFGPPVVSICSRHHVAGASILTPLLYFEGHITNALAPQLKEEYDKQQAEELNSE